MSEVPLYSASLLLSTSASRQVANIRAQRELEAQKVTEIREKRLRDAAVRPSPTHTSLLPASCVPRL